MPRNRISHAKTNETEHYYVLHFGTIKTGILNSRIHQKKRTAERGRESVRRGGGGSRERQHIQFQFQIDSANAKRPNTDKKVSMSSSEPLYFVRIVRTFLRFHCRRHNYHIHVSFSVCVCSCVGSSVLPLRFTSKWKRERMKKWVLVALRRTMSAIAHTHAYTGTVRSCVCTYGWPS